MHYHAEYGAASHWAYKNRMRASLANKAPSTAAPASATPDGATVTAESSASEASSPTDASGSSGEASGAASGPMHSVKAGPDARPAEVAVEPGQPVLCVDEGYLCDGVVISSNSDGSLITVVTTIRSRWTTQPELQLPEGSGIEQSRLLLQSDYRDLWSYARSRCLELPGHQDARLEVREFRRFRGGKYAHVDRFGAMHQFCTLAFVTPSETDPKTDTSDELPADDVAQQSAQHSSSERSPNSTGTGNSADAAHALAAESESMGASGKDLQQDVVGGSKGITQNVGLSLKGSSKTRRKSKVANKMDFTDAQQDAPKLGKWERFKATRAAATGVAPRGGVDENRVLQLRAQLEWGDSATVADEETSATNGRRGPRRGAQQRLPESRRQLFELSRAGDLLTRTGLRAGPDSESGGSSAAASAGSGSTSSSHRMESDGQCKQNDDAVVHATGSNSASGCIDTHSHAEHSIPSADGVPGVDMHEFDAAAEPAGSISVYIYNVGVTDVPVGVTAGDVIQKYGRIEISGEEEVVDDTSDAEHNAGAQEGKKLVNVNNQLVDEDTMLSAGDLVVLSDQVLSNI